MARKKQMDNLSKDMVQCKKDGYGCHYGKWKAMQQPVKFEKCDPDGWLVCENCGKAFKPKTKRLQRFCEYICQHQAYQRNNRELLNARKRECVARKKQRRMEDG